MMPERDCFKTQCVFLFMDARFRETQRVYEYIYSVFTKRIAF
jgi:hypothetical protein